MQRVTIKSLIVTLEDVALLPLRIIKSSGKIIITGAFYYAVFVTYNHVNNKNTPIRVEKDSGLKNDYIEVPVPEVEDLPFDIVTPNPKGKPSGKVIIGPWGVFLLKNLKKPVISMGEKYYNRLVEKKGSFHVNIRDSEMKLSEEENHDPYFEEYEEKLYGNLDEN